MARTPSDKPKAHNVPPDGLPDAAGSKQVQRPLSGHPKARSTSFKPGQSGNPAGRPKGARNRLSENLLATLADDFAKHGADAIRAMRTEKPVDYVRTCASLVPKAFDLGDDEDDDGNRVVGVALITRNAIEAIIERGREDDGDA